MDWYLPITILPGLGMLILSTVTQMMSLSTEIADLISVRCTDFNHMIADKKIKQLGLLTRAGALLYIAAGAYVLSGILGALNYELIHNLPNYILYFGTILLLIALVLLITYAVRTVKIRKLQFANNHNLHKH